MFATLARNYSLPPAFGKSRLEEFLDERGGRSLVKNTRVTGNNLTGWADEHGEGQAATLITVSRHDLDSVQLAVQGGVVEADLVSKGRHFVTIVDGDPKQLQTAFAIALLKRDEHGNLV